MQSPIGIRELDFKTDDGDEVKGTQIFYSYPSDGVIGEKTDKLFVRKGSFQLPPELAPGKHLDWSLSRRLLISKERSITAPGADSLGMGKPFFTKSFSVRWPCLGRRCPRPGVENPRYSAGQDFFSAAGSGCHQPRV